jgi:hypothetical protein
MKSGKTLGTSLLGVGALLLGCMPAVAADSSNTVMQRSVAFGAGRVTETLPVPVYGLHLANPPRRIPKPRTRTIHDSVQQTTLNPSDEFSMNYHALGVGNGFPGYSVPDAPPDTTMAVGDSEIVQWVNVSYADFNKSTGAIIPLNGQDSTLGNAIWHALLPGTACANNNDGDPIVKFDRAAHRWIMTQNVFSSPYAVCVAVSQTATFSDNLWNAYQFPVVNNGFPDYTKWGVWSNGGTGDGYYQTWNNFGPGGSGFQGPVVCGYNRQKMLAGDPSAEQICHQFGITPQYQDGLLPADRDSIVAPPATQDEFFIGSLGDVDNSHLSLYSMHVTSWSGGSATYTGDQNSQLLSIAEFNPACNGNYGGACVPQQGVTDKLDSLGDRLMYRFAYWEDQVQASVGATPPIPPPLQHWYVNWDVTDNNGANAVRWMEVTANVRTVQPTALQVFQQGTYSGNPDDNLWRWMGSLTRDKAQDILVGYSVSSSSSFPAIAVAGRIFTDPHGTLSPEQYAVHGTGSQPDTGNRWGDYSTMSIDPIDNCTFYYTTEYYMATQTFDWSTDISSWKFSNCH